MMQKKRRNVLNIAKRKEIIDKLKNKLASQKQIALEYGVANSVITRIKNEETNIVNTLNTRSSLNKKTNSRGLYEDIEKILIAYILSLKSCRIPINEDLLKEKALIIAERLEHKNFQASNGWIRNFKRRNDIKVYKCVGSEKLVDEDVVSEFQKSEIIKILKKYKPHQIYNADETGLFYELLPSHTHTFKKDSPKYSKDSKKRITIMLCTNMSGNSKLMPLVIGGFKSPRCFKGLNELPVIYKANTNSWMTSLIFNEWLCLINEKQRKKREKIAILIDNAPCHTINETKRFEFIDIIFLPKNTTSRLQPLDQGIIRSFKSIYKKKLLRTIIGCIESGNKPKITLLDAILMVASSWNAVSVLTIVNCFNHAFNSKSEALVPANECEKHEQTDDEVKKLQMILPNAAILPGFCEVDDDLIHEKPSLDACIEDYKMETNKKNDISEVVGDSGTSNEEIIDVIKYKDVNKALNTIKLYVLRSQFASEESVQKVLDVENICERLFEKSKIQSTLDRFLN